MTRYRTVLRLSIVAAALLDFYVTRFSMFSDGISYLEIADQYRSGAWRSAVNAYWSPLYSWLLAIATLPLTPGSYYEAVALHLVNLTALLASLLAFEFLLRQRDLLEPVKGTRHSRLLLLVAYSLFAWGALGLLGCGYVAPDLTTTIWIYLLSGLIIRFRRSVPTLLEEMSLGVIVALAYFTKTAMLPIGLVYIATTGWAARNVRTPLIAALTCLVVIAPWLWALHDVTGAWTIGRSGTLNYAWEVLGVTRSTHWQGGDPQFGWPQHPTRRLLTGPLVFEYGGPIRATYPPWYDPSFWHAGLRLPFSLTSQTVAAVAGGSYALVLLASAPGFVVGIFLMQRRRAGRFPFHSSDVWLIFLPAVIAVLLYSLVFVEKRYIAAQLVVLNVCVMSGWSRGTAAFSARIRRGLNANVLLSCTYYFLVYLAAASLVFVLDVTGRQRLVNVHWQIAREMYDYGLRQGTRVAYLGLPVSAYWARLAGVRIVAEVPVEFDRERTLSRALHIISPDLELFWKADEDGQRRVLDAFRAAGATFVVADIVPAWADTTGWHKLTAIQRIAKSSTATYVRRLVPPGEQ